MDFLFNWLSNIGLGNYGLHRRTDTTASGGTTQAGGATDDGTIDYATPPDYLPIAHGSTNTVTLTPTGSCYLNAPPKHTVYPAVGSIPQVVYYHATGDWGVAASGGHMRISKVQAQQIILAQQQNMQNMTTLALAQAQATINTLLYGGDLKPVVEDAGIHPGEIIAYRCWWVDPDMWLRSMAMDTPWYPGAPLDGHPTETNQFGVHAFKTMERAKATYGDFNNTKPFAPVVYGTVALWGTVIEHEDGYRAEYGQPEQLLELHHLGTEPLDRYTMLMDLRKKYARPAHEV